jgi:hypothetical protein
MNATISTMVVIEALSQKIRTICARIQAIAPTKESTAQVEKVEALIRLAVNGAASSEEARTAALEACRRIHAAKMEIRSKGSLERGELYVEMLDLYNKMIIALPSLQARR